MRAVLDSNVLISAAISSGPSHRIVERWFASEPFELIVCERILEEVETVLVEGSKLRRWISREAAELYVERLGTTADVLPDPPEGPPLTRDPADDFVVYLARRHGADVIVSGDADLLEWPEQDPSVMDPAAFVEILPRRIDARIPRPERARFSPRIVRETLKKAPKRRERTTTV